MSIGDFESVLKKMKRAGTPDVVKLLGGEPTLHSRFDEAIRLSLKYFSRVQVFTNGIFSERVVSVLRNTSPRVGITFNVMTPGFLMNKGVAASVSKRIAEFAPVTDVALALTIDPHTNVPELMNHLAPLFANRIHTVRIGVSNPVAGEANTYSFEEFPRIGTLITELLDRIEAMGSARVSFNCGLTRCMFTSAQMEKMKGKNIRFYGWGCHGKKSSGDVSVSLEAFHCFPLAGSQRVSLRKESLAGADKKLLLQRHVYWNTIQLETCKKCPFHGPGIDQCPGPCIGFRMNALSLSPNTKKP